MQQRFLAKIERIPFSSCWYWSGYCMPKGYGHFGVSSKRQNALAHRVAWEIFRGDIPSGMFVCHRCDVPGCVNPEHLFLGTNSDNIQDAVAKGALLGGNRKVTHCPAGHLYDATNTRVTRQNRRVCRACETIRVLAYRKDHLEEVRRRDRINAKARRDKRRVSSPRPF